MALCKTLRCKNKASWGEVCNTCYQRAWNKKNPLRRAYRDKKSNSKRKGIPFELTLEQFQKFAIESDYVRGRGRKSLSYHIDRIKKYWPDGSVRGYDIDNIQVLTGGANSRKQLFLDKYYDTERQKMHWSVSTWVPNTNLSEAPF